MLANRHKSRKGTAVMEMALVLPLLLALTFGLIEFGFFFFVKHTVQNAAREGARSAVVPASNNTSVSTAVNGSLSASGFSTSLFTITVKVNGTVANASTAQAGDSVTVLVNVPWGSVGVRPLGIMSASRNVQGASVMRREG